MKEKIIGGNVKGVRDSVLDRLKDIYDIKSRNQIINEEICGIICNISNNINKEICVMISRDGSVLDVSIGDSGSVKLKSFNTTHSNHGLCGVRCVHTHPNGSGLLSSVDVGSLNSVKYDAMVAIGTTGGKATDISVGILNKKDDEGLVSQNIYGMFKINSIPNDALFDEIYNAIKLNREEDYVEEKERALLIAIDDETKYDSLKELKKLSGDAGLNVVCQIRQKRDKADSSYYIGKGKTSEISLLCSSERIDVVICDDELSSAQTRNLEEELGVKIIDRTALILDIFAARATTKEGKLQVELAQQKYRLPRLKGMGKVLSRLGGGIGTRGPGEKKLEIDSRHIKRRIFELEKQIKELETQRELRRKKAQSSTTPVCSLVGYTNAGKSTLLNRLSGSDVLAKDKLFATLDPVTRKVNCDGFDILLSDTVGFINKLPHDLVSAFRSTLEQAKFSDVILHIMDSSSEYLNVQRQVVSDVLESLNITDIPIINVYNKWDKSIIDENEIEKDAIKISALNGEGIEYLFEQIEQTLNSGFVSFDVVIPYEKGKLNKFIHNGIVESQEYLENGVRFIGKLEKTDYERLMSELNE